MADKKERKEEMRTVVMVAASSWKPFPTTRYGLLHYYLLVLLGLSCFGDLISEAQTLPEQEVNAIQQIASKLNFSVAKEPCNTLSTVDPSNSIITKNLTCFCNGTSCHVTSILLKGQNLSGVLPVEFANLTHLSVLDLTWNYLNGSIPAAWASLPLTILSLFANRISGRIPEEIGNITTLQALVLENNQMEGPLPPALGKLINLERFVATSNNFSGELPKELGNLKNLTEFRIDGNLISGKIPSFIENWTNLQILDMQGTSMEGPFPSSFSTLETITELRVSDLKRGNGEFPPLQNMKKMIELVLRNLSISGEIPGYIGEMTNLKNLDLSFNNLTGAIPSNQNIKFMYLTNNMLNESIPSWILSSKGNLDLSYNNFTGPSTQSSCQLGDVNLFWSYSSTDNNSLATCLRRNIPCSEKATNYEFFINCGGDKVTINDKEYEADPSPRGMSEYGLSESGKWVSSSTGDFVGDENAKYTTTNTSVLSMTNPQLYMTARLNPLSLKYHGLCLQKGNYTVKLHFAEIMFTDDQTFTSVGKRIFDVSIQGQKVLQDFNIAEEANGTGREIIKNFTAIVDGSTLEIHFQWAGKGTNGIPKIGVYGPLISAISVTPNFVPKTEGSKLSVGSILGIAAASCVVIVLFSIVLWLCCRRKDPENNELRGLELQTGYFSLKQIKAATRNFDPANKIGEGGFGPVYKGVLPDGAEIAVKQLSSKSKQGNREFVNEIGMISALQHPNLVKLFGCCVERNQLLVIYEYMENNSLARALFGPVRNQLKLDWKTRRKICQGIAKGLAYLHEESRLKIVHRDIKATNVLLDKNLNAKISDFGLAKLDEEGNTHISTRIAGTIGYMAPEYAMRGHLTYKADVYSFGVVTLEIVSGMSNTSYRRTEDFVYLLDWAYVLHEQGSLLELVDPSLGSDYSKDEALQMLSLALICANPSPTLRPTMSTVVSMLDGRMPVKVPSVKYAPSAIEDLRFKSFEKLSSDSQMPSTLINGSWVYTSMSAHTHSSKEESTSSSSASKLHVGQKEYFTT